MTDVTFRVPLRDARHERVFLLGDSREFGKWQLEDAFPLRWTPGDVWIGQLRLHAGTYEFKVRFQPSSLASCFPTLDHPSER